VPILFNQLKHYDVDELSKILVKDSETIRREIAGKKLRATQYANKLYVSENDLKLYLGSK